MPARFFVVSSLLLASAMLAGAGQPLPTPPERMLVEAAAHKNAGGPVIVEDECETARKGIGATAAQLLHERNYDQLDSMAGALRSDPRTFAQGTWPILFFYDGVADLPDGSGAAAWEAHIQALRDWFETDPDSITPRVALARGLVSYAWKARGSGWAKDVTRDGWRLFGERITEAHRILNAAASLGQVCPVYYSTRLRVALAQSVSPEEYDAIFNEATEAFPNYPSFYLVKVNYLLPRWFGEEGDCEKFAAAAADRIGGEAGDRLYAQIVWSLHDLRIYGNILKETSFQWPRLQRGFEALCRTYPNSISAPSEYCYLAGFTPEGRQVTRALFPRLNERVDLSVWKTMERWIGDHAFAFEQ